MKALKMVFKIVAAALLATFMLAIPASAAVDTALSGAVTDVTTFWGTILDLLIAVAIAGVAITFFLKLRRRS